MSTYLVIPPGTLVHLPQAEIKDAMVIAVQIKSNNSISYNVCWWAGRERKEAWLEECEVSTDEPKYAHVGFIKPKERP